MQTAAITSQAALTLSPCVNATIVKKTVPSATTTADDNIV